MRRILALVLVACFLLALPGCGGEEADLGDQFVMGSDNQYYFGRPLGISMTESADHYYFFGSHYLYSKSKATGEETVLCNKPDCLHDHEEDGTRVTGCNAMFLGPESIAFCNDKLYVLDNIVNAELERTQKIYEVDAGGTTRKEIFEAKEFIGSYMVHRGYLYVSFTDFLTAPEEYQDAEELKTLGFRVDRYNLQNLSKPPQTIYQSTGTWGQINHMSAYGNQLYFYMSGSDNPDLVTYNLQDKKAVPMQIDKIGMFMSPITILDSHLLFFENLGVTSTEFLESYEDQKAVVADLQGNQTGELALPCEDLYANDEFIITDNESLVRFDVYTREERAVQIFDKEGTLLKKVELDSDTMPALGMNEDYFFYMKRPASENDSTEIWALDLHKIGEPNLAGEPFFCYVAPVHFPGVITP